MSIVSEFKLKFNFRCFLLDLCFFCSVHWLDTKIALIPSLARYILGKFIFIQANLTDKTKRMRVCLTLKIIMYIKLLFDVPRKIADETKKEKLIRSLCDTACENGIYIIFVPFLENGKKTKCERRCCWFDGNRGDGRMGMTNSVLFFFFFQTVKMKHTHEMTEMAHNATYGTVELSPERRFYEKIVLHSSRRDSKWLCLGSYTSKANNKTDEKQIQVIEFMCWSDGGIYLTGFSLFFLCLCAMPPAAIALLVPLPLIPRVGREKKAKKKKKNTHQTNNEL